MEVILWKSTSLTRATVCGMRDRGTTIFPACPYLGEEEQPIGLWGQRHLRYIRECRKALYISLRLSGKLNSYLEDIGQRAQERLDTIIR